MIGAHVFKDDRLGLWAIENSGLTDKLKHVLPRVRSVMPVTDIFLPPSATLIDKQVVRDNGFFVAGYDVANGRGPTVLGDAMVGTANRLGLAVLEADIELPNDDKLAPYITAFVKRVRMHKPNIRLRINVAPFKGYRLPISLFESDPNLFVIAQAYSGNMDGRLSEADVLSDLLDWGIHPDDASVMYGVMNGNPRVYTLPSTVYRAPKRGSLYSDDLLIGAGVLPA